eukprot:m.38641 g.38641  ORF g.38641 m.38641 type:complete len:306 (+) comp14652_c0_seq3:1123-2040(+)
MHSPPMRSTSSLLLLTWSASSVSSASTSALSLAGLDSSGSTNVMRAHARSSGLRTCSWVFLMARLLHAAQYSTLLEVSTAPDCSPHWKWKLALHFLYEQPTVAPRSPHAVQTHLRPRAMALNTLRHAPCSASYTSADHRVQLAWIQHTAAASAVCSGNRRPPVASGWSPTVEHSTHARVSAALRSARTRLTAATTLPGSVVAAGAPPASGKMGAVVVEGGWEGAAAGGADGCSGGGVAWSSMGSGGTIATARGLHGSVVVRSRSFVVAVESAAAGSNTSSSTLTYAHTHRCMVSVAGTDDTIRHS